MFGFRCAQCAAENHFEWTVDKTSRAGARRGVIVEFATAGEKLLVRGEYDGYGRILVSVEGQEDVRCEVLTASLLRLKRRTSSSGLRSGPARSTPRGRSCPSASSATAPRSVVWVCLCVSVCVCYPLNFVMVDRSITTRWTSPRCRGGACPQRSSTSCLRRSSTACRRFRR